MFQERIPCDVTLFEKGLNTKTVGEQIVPLTEAEFCSVVLLLKDAVRTLANASQYLRGVQKEAVQVQLNMLDLLGQTATYQIKNPRTDAGEMAYYLYGQSRDAILSPLLYRVANLESMLQGARTGGLNLQHPVAARLVNAQRFLIRVFNTYLLACFRFRGTHFDSLYTCYRVSKRLGLEDKLCYRNDELIPNYFFHYGENKYLVWTLVQNSMLFTGIYGAHYVKQGLNVMFGAECLQSGDRYAKLYGELTVGDLLSGGDATPTQIATGKDYTSVLVKPNSLFVHV